MIGHQMPQFHPYCAFAKPTSSTTQAHSTMQPLAKPNIVTRRQGQHQLLAVAMPPAQQVLQAWPRLLQQRHARAPVTRSWCLPNAMTAAACRSLLGDCQAASTPPLLPCFTTAAQQTMQAPRQRPPSTAPVWYSPCMRACRPSPPAPLLVHLEHTQWGPAGSCCLMVAANSAGVAHAAASRAATARQPYLTNNMV